MTKVAYKPRKLIYDIINFIVNSATRKYLMSLHIEVSRGWVALWYANRSQLTTEFCR